MLIGRYLGDGYAGGNPWQLLTAVTAEFYYRLSNELKLEIEQNGNFVLI